MINLHESDGYVDYVWHWTHTPPMVNDRSNRRQIQMEKYMLITVPGIGDVSNGNEP